MNIHIRHAEADDYKAIHQLYSMPNAIAGTLQLPFPSEALWKKRLAETPTDTYVLVAEVDGQARGLLGLWIESKSPRRRHAGGIGMAVHDDWQGKGIGSKLLQSALELADNWLNLMRLELTVFTDNPAAQKLYEKYGFEIEGTHKHYALKQGVLCDVYAMARLRPASPQAAEDQPL